MKSYVRPSTLFATKFVDYHEEAINELHKQKDTRSELRKWLEN